MRKTIFVALLSVLILSACGGQGKHSGKRGSSGKTLELMVVSDKEVYNTEVKALVDTLFAMPQPCLPQPEPMFDIVHITKSSFESVDMFRVHRNVVLLDINAENNNKVYRHIDKYSVPQVIYDIAAKDQHSLDSLLQKYEKAIKADMYDAEHKRVWKAYKSEEGIEVQQKLEKDLGISLKLSDKYSIAKLEDGFAWVRIEAKDFGIGLLIQRRPYLDKRQLEQPSLLDSIDSMMCKVPGPSEGSYMGVERRRDKETNEYLMPIEVNSVKFPSSLYCAEVRGCWRLFGNFMGGPFVSYSVLTEDNKEVVTLVGYVYCPRNKPYTKRDLLMQLESVCYSMEVVKNQ